ncbi:putative nonribosomal peptide synthase [Tricladium varicosporioides]|nr:putative nonribosomal peptide synthase [Hymenoscyphus varicosporioides]
MVSRGLLDYVGDGLPDKNGHAQQPLRAGVDSDIDIPSTHLPTLSTRSKAKDTRIRLAKSLSWVSKSKAEQHDILIKIWAILLHTYVMSDMVAFVVIGDLATKSSTSVQLVVSHLSADLALGSTPQITRRSFEVSKHGSKVNTAVGFSDVHHLSEGFSYVLNLSEEGPANLHLYTQPSSVPQKFISALWSTFLEIDSNTGSSGHLPINISRVDQRAIQSFMPSLLYDTPMCVHQLFRQSVRVIPSAAAVHAWDGVLTYDELDIVSNKFAAQLMQIGVQKGQYVPFSFEKSVWMVVAVLGILKAGGALVAIDPSQPSARVREIVQEIHATVVVVSPSQISSFAGFVDTIVPISSDTMQSFNNVTRETPELPQVQPDDPAVLIFTSGSTGKPKGIIIEHAAFSSRFMLEGIACSYQGVRTLQFSASTWDIFMTDIFTTLAFHGCVCIPNEEDRRFNIPKVCADYNVSLALFTPTLANLLDPNMFPTLKTLIFAGEALTEDVVQKWSAIQGLSLISAYGPAEAGICIAGKVADRPEILGYALDHSICILVDPNNHDKLAPIGAVGELVIGGPAVLREYINRPDKTSVSIIKDPAWSVSLELPVRRFYKTGDLLRYSIDTLDGCFEFVGRRDSQIKYHGQRIELGEIEHHLSSLPGIRRCMVTLVTKGTLKNKLVAVVQCDGHNNRPPSQAKFSVQHDAIVTISDVRHFLSTRLPDYMIPNELLVLIEMPQSASMKLDRALINEWISNLEAIRSDTPSIRQVQQSDRLATHESTAREIANEYARIVAGNDEYCRKTFEELDFNLQSGGIDSVQIMSLAAFLNRRYKVQVPMAEILSSKSTIRTIASIVDTNKFHLPHLKKQSPDPTLEDEVNIQLKSISHTLQQDYVTSKVERVFLTGASGFLGLEILRQLLTRSNCDIFVLGRGSSEKDIRARLIEMATAAGWWQATFHSKLHVWQGDLSKVHLGLSNVHWQILRGKSSSSIDAIIHNGAKVHYNLDYDSVKSTNVSSTVELLKAVSGRETPLHSFVFVSGGQQLSFDSKDDAKYTSKAANGCGYARSKVVSELIIERFSKQEGRKSKVRHIRVVKPGYIIGDSQRGVANKADFIWRLIAASIEIGCYNEQDEDSWLFVADVTRVSHQVLRSVFEEDCDLVTKILDGMTLKDLWALLRNQFDYDIHPATREQWLSRLRQAIEIKQEKHVMFPLMYMLEANDEPLGVPDGPSQATAGVEAAINANITQLINIGFLPTPAFIESDSSTESVAISKTSETPSFDAIDMELVRENFPALHEGTVAFNNAAGTAVYKGAIEKAREYMCSLPIDPGLDDKGSRKVTEQRENTLRELAAFMNASPDEIAFGPSATFLFRSLGQALRPMLNSDCEMVVSSMCHEASAGAWVSLAKDLNIAIKWWSPPPGDDPCLSLSTLEPLLSPKTRIVACNHVSNVIGTIHPIRQIADMVHNIPGAIFIVDGVAWAPHRPIDVRALDVDFYCISWYKIFGPHISQLYGRRSVQQRSMKSISHFFLDEIPGLDWRLRLGCNTYELEESLVPIVRYIGQVGWDKIIAQEAVLQNVFLTYLRRRPQLFRIFGEKSSDPENRVSLITFQVIGKSSRVVADSVNQLGRFRISSGNNWAPRPTHDVLRLDEDGLIRVSFVHYNTITEVQGFCKELDAVLGSMEAGNHFPCADVV